MKIAMIGQKWIPSREGGVEVVVQELSSRLVKDGYQVTCYNRKKNSKEKTIKQFNGIKIINCFTLNKKGLATLVASFFGTIKILFSNNEVVHYHAEGSCAWLWIIKFFSKKKIVVTIHGLDWQRAKWGKLASKFIKFGEKCAVKYADEIIVLSENAKKYFKEIYNRDTNIIPNGVNKPTKRISNIIKKKYNLEKESYILFLARIVPEKGLQYLIEAYKKIKTEKKLVIAGDSLEKDNFYKEIMTECKQNDNIITTGFVEGEELEELYTNCYIYILPSDLEGMPISLLEAMSYGRNCIVSNIKENMRSSRKYDFII